MTDEARRRALALHAQGLAALDAGNAAQAADLLAAAAQAAPAVAGLHANHGLALHALGDVAGAAAAYRRALVRDPSQPAARNSLGTALQDQGFLTEAAAAFRAALALAPDYPAAAANLGGALHGRKRHAEAEKWLRRALRGAPDDHDASVTLAAVLLETGAVGAAESLLGEALRRDPGDGRALVNLALIHEKRGDWATAERLCRQRPDEAAAAWNLALLLLRQGRLAEGWRLYERRFAAEPNPNHAPPPLPRWAGEPLAGRRLLVWREQGLGDALMFGVLLPQLAARATQEGSALTVAVDPRLVGLFARALPSATVVAAPSNGACPAFGADLHCPMGSLPGLLRPSLADWSADGPNDGGTATPSAAPSAAPLFAPRPDLAASWRDRLTALGPGLKIGLAWRSAVADASRAGAYLTPADLAPLAAAPGVRLINLQYDLATAEIDGVCAALGAPLAVWPDADLRNDLETAAALTAACDLVICPASSVGEMAGALGVPVWRFGAKDWTMLGTGARPWFPVQKIWPPLAGENLAAVPRRMAAALARLADERPVDERLAAERQADDGFDALLRQAADNRAAGRGADAEKAYQAALERRPAEARALTGYAGLAREAGRPDLAAMILGGAALSAIDQPAAADERAAAFSAWAAATQQAGDLDGAAKIWWGLIIADPGDDRGFAGLANLRAGQGRHPQALRGWRRAIRAAPGYGPWRYNQGNSLKALGRLDEADAAYQAAARLDDAPALADFNRGYTALERGRVGEGWDGLEKRFIAGQAEPDRRFSCPRWDGGPLNGGDLLIWREQGVGDEIMFATCYADAARRAKAAGAGRVLIDAEPRLAGLLARALPADVAAFTELRPWRGGEDPPSGAPPSPEAIPATVAAHIPAGSLPWLSRRRLSDFPAVSPAILAPEPAAVAAWRATLEKLGPGLKLGICWRSGLAGPLRQAAATDLADWGPLLTAPGLRLVNLQYDDCADELDAAERRFGVKIYRPAGLDLRNDLEGVAALCAALDLAASVGTSAAEIAAATGTPTWRLCRPGEWSALGVPCRPWFPAVRLIHPPAGENLAQAVAVAAAELARLRPTLCKKTAEPAPLQSKKTAPPAASPAPKGKPADLLARGVALHKAGDVAAAAAHYRAVPRGTPVYADARHLLGMIASADGRFAEALDDFAAAIKINGKAPDFHANHAYALHGAGRFADAAAAAERALKLAPRHPEAANMLAAARGALGDWAGSAAAARSALQARPGYPEALANLGVALARIDMAQARPALRQALAAAPRHGPARGAWADALAAAGDWPGALRHRRIRVALQPANPAGWAASAEAEDKLNPLDKTAVRRCLRRAVLAAPDVAEFWARAGATARVVGDQAAAAYGFSRAAALAPGWAGALSNLALSSLAPSNLALSNLAAERWFARALAADPVDGLSRFNRGLSHLKNGDLAAGWRDYAGRLDAGGFFVRPDLPFPFWRGESLRGRRLLVWREQGLGDELLFASLYPLLRRAAENLTLACDPRLVGLFARSFPGVAVLSLAECARRPPPDVDFQIAAGSLAGLLAPGLADFPIDAGGWLRPDPALRAAAADRLAALGPGLKIGVAWTSARVDAARAAAYLQLADLAPLRAVPGAVLVNLQYDRRPDPAAGLADFPDIDLKNDLEQSAALTAACDLVVSVASSTAEIAAALGVPVWRLGGRDWTMLGTAARPWGPSMRIFSPKAGEPLSATAHRVAAALRQLSGTT